jgi:hypothetical protein
LRGGVWVGDGVVMDCSFAFSTCWILGFWRWEGGGCDTIRYDMIRYDTI